jgi:hypothetical protein
MVIEPVKMGRDVGPPGRFLQGKFDAAKVLAHLSQRPETRLVQMRNTP